MLAAMVAGESDPAVLAGLARRRLRAKRSELEQALTGRMRAHHRFLLDSHLKHLDFLGEQIERYSAEIAVRMEDLDLASDGRAAGRPGSTAGGEGGRGQEVAADQGGEGRLGAAEAVALLDTIPGIDRWQAEVILAEIGLDMGRFPTAGHLASWAGLAPGNNESAGKRYSGKTRPGNATLCKTLVLAANAAARSKNSYLAAQYNRLAARRGKKRAIVALAHSILVAVYHILSRREPYRDLGGNYFDERKRESVTNRLVRRLEKLGYDVALCSKPSTAAATP
jgi:transposase